MTPIDKEIIRRRLSIIIDNLKAFRTIKKMSQKEYDGDLYRRKAAERLLQELIEASIDINVHVISQTEEKVPDDYFESFIKAGSLNIISKELSEKLAPCAGLRNRLVHEYDEIDNSLIFKAVKDADALLNEYIRQIEKFISEK